jgi:hypothetical protein
MSALTNYREDLGFWEDALADAQQQAAMAWNLFLAAQSRLDATTRKIAQLQRTVGKLEAAGGH